jgi:uncharacterized protein (TIGR02646 family)
MITVDRSRIPCPSVLDLTDTTSKGAIETAQAIANASSTPRKASVYAIYRHETVRLALINLFYGKCAYCETSTNATSARDIEHFRPKGRISPGNGKKAISPGYYWLAATWDNLVLACQACNRSQRQLRRNAAGEFIYEKKATGKLDLFPIRGSEQNRVRLHNQNISDEEQYRLLLHPCQDEPDKHLLFDDQGNVLPREINGVLSDMGEWSIEVYELWRNVLVEERKARYLDVLGYWQNIKDIAALMDEAQGSQIDTIAKVIRRNEAKIISSFQNNQPYAGMLRQLTAVWLVELVDIKTTFATMFGRQI